ncbi:predicted protein, partial [Nematostella vectensis]
DGNYSQWSEWTSCTVTCGGGEQMRSRTCTNPTPHFGGKDCSAIGASTETGSCQTQECPVNGGYSEWSAWTECSATCGGGTQMRNRKCNNPNPQNGGKNCIDMGLGSEIESRMCNQNPC